MNRLFCSTTALHSWLLHESRVAWFLARDVICRLLLWVRGKEKRQGEALLSARREEAIAPPSRQAATRVVDETFAIKIAGPMKTILLRVKFNTTTMVLIIWKKCSANGDSSKDLKDK